MALSWLAITKTQGNLSLTQAFEARSGQASDLTAMLTRNSSGAGGSTVDVTLATPAFFQLTESLGLPARLFTSQRPTLEALFLHLTGRTLRE